MKNWKDSSKKIHMAVSIVAAIFLLVLYILIFGFSEQDGETSGSLSHRITEAIVNQVGRFVGEDWTEELKLSLVGYWEHPVRKLAHFSEYALMAVLLYLIWRPWKARTKKLYAGLILWVFLSAAFDEGHQLLVPGRCGSFWDVLLDTSGGAFGLFVCTISENLARRLGHGAD